MLNMKFSLSSPLLPLHQIHCIFFFSSVSLSASLSLPCFLLFSVSHLFLSLCPSLPPPSPISPSLSYLRILYMWFDPNPSQTSPLTSLPTQLCVLFVFLTHHLQFVLDAWLPLEWMDLWRATPLKKTHWSSPESVYQLPIMISSARDGTSRPLLLSMQGFIYFF